MYAFRSNRPPIWILSLAVSLLAGCAEADRLSVWPLGGKTTDVVPGLPSPAERIATLRKIGRKATWAEPAEQERLSGELAAAFAEEADPLIRGEIVRALGEYPTAAAAGALRTALKDSDADVRIAACEAWGRRAGAEATTLLGEVLSSDVDIDVRLAAARALGRTGDAAAVAALGEALEDHDPAMQYRAVASLRQITGEDLGNDVNRWRLYVKGETPTPSPPVSLAERLRRLF